MSSVLVFQCFLLLFWDMGDVHSTQWWKRSDLELSASRYVLQPHSSRPETGQSGLPRGPDACCGKLAPSQDFCWLLKLQPADVVSVIHFSFLSWLGSNCIPSQYGTLFLKALQTTWNICHGFHLSPYRAISTQILVAELCAICLSRMKDHKPSHLHFPVEPSEIGSFYTRTED